MFDDTTVDDLTTFIGSKILRYSLRMLPSHQGCCTVDCRPRGIARAILQRVWVHVTTSCRVTQMPRARVGVPVMSVKTISLLGYIVKPTFDLT